MHLKQCKCKWQKYINGTQQTLDNVRDNGVQLNPAWAGCNSEGGVLLFLGHWDLMSGIPRTLVQLFYCLGRSVVQCCPLLRQCQIDAMYIAISYCFGLNDMDGGLEEALCLQCWSGQHSKVG